MADKSNSKSKPVSQEPHSSESGLVSNYSVEVIGLLGLATLIYALIALLFIS